MMIISILLGIFFIAYGVSRREGKSWYKIFIVFGIVFVLFAIYLGVPR